MPLAEVEAGLGDEGGHVPASHDGQMWDLTIPGNNDHDFYVIAQAGDVPVLVHNCGVSDTRIISSSQSREQNLASINVRPSGTGFNAIYDPADRPFGARLSEGEDALVVRNEGHRIISRESFGGSDGTVAFTVRVIQATDLLCEVYFLLRSVTAIRMTCS